MRTSRGSAMTVVVFSLALLSASDVSAIGCWVCQHALDTCFYYRRTGLEDCASGCNRMYPLNSPAWHGCRQACQAEYNAGTSQCQDEYDYCTDGCMQDEDTGPRENCPIVLDLGRHNWHFTSAAAGVRFDIDGDGRPEQIAWTDPEDTDAFLVWDRNLNGTIDSGLELFGDSTVQPRSSRRNGFQALAVLDRIESGGDGDGQITPRDALWPALKVWVDRNHNGRSEQDELAPLTSAGVISIDLATLDSRRRDRHGNELRYRSHVVREGGATDAVDVFFQRTP